jgi:hypothetical protein
MCGERRAEFEDHLAVTIVDGLGRPAQEGKNPLGSYVAGLSSVW